MLNPIIIEPKPVLYSISVDLKEGNKVRLLIQIPDDKENTWYFFRYAGMAIGWKYAEIFGTTCMEAHFMADTPGHADLPAYFVGHNSVDIEIFENDEENPTRIKTINW